MTGQACLKHSPGFREGCAGPGCSTRGYKQQSERRADYAKQGHVTIWHA